MLFFLVFLLSTSSTMLRDQLEYVKLCQNLIFYFNYIIYNDKHIKNVIPTIVGASEWDNKTILPCQHHFRGLVMLDDPMTLDNNLYWTPVGIAQGFYLYDKREIFTIWFTFSVIFKFTKYTRILNFLCIDRLINKTRDILVVSCTGNFLWVEGLLDW